MIDFVCASVFREFLFLVVVPFIVWVVSWWGFISGRLAQGSDAFYYYWDSRFFLDNISRGVYPLWNPDYSGGVPWNFFLRRMGEVNPFYWIISVLKLLGVSPYHSHLIFFVLYYFLGLVGFWLLAKLFLKDRLTATGAYLLLLFSWGGQIFYCFDVLLLVPELWFFYFIFAFAAQKKKHQFLGIFFTAALMVTTYIPFFTWTIIASIFFFFFLFFMKESFVFFKETRHFMGTHKLLTALSLGFFLVSCVPEIGFYIESKGGGFVMPSRHMGSTDPSAVAVAVNNINSGVISAPRVVWDVIAHGYFDRVFANQEGLGIGDFTIAYLFFIVFLLSIINPVSRRTSFLLVTGVFITLIAMTKSRLYPFLLDHVFFFHYMRMLQLFFWLAVLPMAILMAMEQLRVFLRDHQGRGNMKVLAFVVCVHVLFLAGLLTQEGVVWSSYFAVGTSLVFFILAIMGWKAVGAVDIWLWLSLIIQPVAFAHYIERNSVACNPCFVNDRNSFYHERFSLQSMSLKPEGEDGIKQEGGVKLGSAGYYENPWLDQVRQYVFQDNLGRFVARQLLLFDNTVPEDDSSQEKFYATLTRMWGALQNSVFLPSEGSMPEDFRSLAPGVKKAHQVYAGSSQVKVLAFDANTLRLQTSIDRPRFLLWTNGYAPGWHVTIDGHEGRLLRADYGFKGVWIPSGEHTVVFRFGTPLRYAMAYLLLGVFVVMMVMVVVWGFGEELLV